MRRIVDRRGGSGSGTDQVAGRIGVGCKGNRFQCLREDLRDVADGVNGQGLENLGRHVVQVRLVRVADGKPVSDAVIFESKADMGPAGMETMTAPVKAMSPKGGLYSFEIDPGMAGAWALHLAAKVQGEPETVRGTVNADLVK